MYRLSVTVNEAPACLTFNHVVYKRAVICEYSLFRFPNRFLFWTVSSCNHSVSCIVRVFSCCFSPLRTPSWPACCSVWSIWKRFSGWRPLKTLCWIESKKLLCGKSFLFFLSLFWSKWMILIASVGIYCQYFLYVWNIGDEMLWALCMCAICLSWESWKHEYEQGYYNGRGGGNGK